MADNVKRRYSRCWKTRRRRCQGQTLHPGPEAHLRRLLASVYFELAVAFASLQGRWLSLLVLRGTNNIAAHLAVLLCARVLSTRELDIPEQGRRSVFQLAESKRCVASAPDTSEPLAALALHSSPLCHTILRPSRLRNPQHRHYSEPPRVGPRVRCVRRACVHPPTHSSC
jgi:hypothetical protein